MDKYFMDRGFRGKPAYKINRNSEHITTFHFVMNRRNACDPVKLVYKACP